MTPEEQLNVGSRLSALEVLMTAVLPIALREVSADRLRAIIKSAERDLMAKTHPAPRATRLAALAIVKREMSPTLNAARRRNE